MRLLHGGIGTKQCKLLATSASCNAYEHDRLPHSVFRRLSVPADPRADVRAGQQKMMPQSISRFLNTQYLII